MHLQEEGRRLRAVPVRLRRPYRCKLLDLSHSEIEDGADALVRVYAMMLPRM
jgi:hypothetical protein